LTGSQDTIFAFIHNAGNKVFFRYNHGEYYSWNPPGCYFCSNIIQSPATEPDQLLYDFGLEAGDIFTSSCNFRRGIVITSVDTVVISGSKRRRLCYEGDTNGCWIEGFGDTNGFLHPFRKYPTGSGGYGQIAVVQNGNLIVFNENYRDLIDELYSSVDKITNGAKVKVFQNQADKEITVTSSSDPLKYVGLYSTSGVLINEKFCDRQLETVISAQSFGKGVYLVKIVLQSGTSETHKIIVK